MFLKKRARIFVTSTFFHLSGLQLIHRGFSHLYKGCDKTSRKSFPLFSWLNLFIYNLFNRLFYFLTGHFFLVHVLTLLMFVSLMRGGFYKIAVCFFVLISFIYASAFRKFSSAYANISSFVQLSGKNWTPRSLSSSTFLRTFTACSPLP